MTGYKADTNVFRTDGQTDQYWSFATMWRIPDNLLHAIVNINASFGSDYFALISQHNLGEGTTVLSCSPYLPTI